MNPGVLMPETIKGHCPSCGPGRNAEVVGHHFERWDDDEAGIWQQTDYSILNWLGCGGVYFQIETIFSEDYDYREHALTRETELYYPPRISYWPAPSKRQAPSWFGELALTDGDL